MKPIVLRLELLQKGMEGVYWKGLHKVRLDPQPSDFPFVLVDRNHIVASGAERSLFRPISLTEACKFDITTPNISCVHNIIS